MDMDRCVNGMFTFSMPYIYMDLKKQNFSN